MPQTARAHIDLLVGANTADFNAINTALNEADTAFALNADFTNHSHSISDFGAPVTRGNAMTVTNGLNISTGNVGIGGAPVANAGIWVQGTINGPTAQSVVADGTLVASANNDNLYGVVIQPTYNDNGKTGVQHWGIWVEPGVQNAFGGITGIGANPIPNNALYIRGPDSSSGTNALLVQNSNLQTILAVRDDENILLPNGMSINSGGDASLRYITTDDTVQGLIQAGHGSLYVRGSGAGGSYNAIFDTGPLGVLITSGQLNVSNTNGIFTTGPVWAPDSYISAGTVVSSVLGDITANRGNATGFVYLGNTATHYLGFDGTNYQLPTSGLSLGGTLTIQTGGANIIGTATINTIIVNSGGISVAAGNLSFYSAANSPNAPLAFNQITGPKINLFDAGSGNFFGLGMNNSEMFMAVPIGNAFTVRLNNGSGTSYPIVASQNGSTDWKFDSGQHVVSSAPSGSVTSTSINFTAAYGSAPNVVATVNTVSGGTSLSALYLVQINGIGTNGFNADVYNNTGGAQTYTINWMAFGH